MDTRCPIYFDELNTAVPSLRGEKNVGTRSMFRRSAIQNLHLKGKCFTRRTPPRSPSPAIFEVLATSYVESQCGMAVLLSTDGRD